METATKRVQEAISWRAQEFACGIAEQSQETTRTA